MIGSIGVPKPLHHRPREKVTLRVLAIGLGVEVGIRYRPEHYLALVEHVVSVDDRQHALCGSLHVVLKGTGSNFGAIANVGRFANADCFLFRTQAA